MLEAFGDNFGPRQSARYANGYRDLYFEHGRSEDMDTALIFYESSLAGLEKERALKSWVLCNRLNLYIHEYRHDRFDRQWLLDEIEAAMEAARRIPFRERKQGHADLWWLLAKRAAIRDEAVKEAGGLGGEIPRGRRLELVGRVAVVPAAFEPEPIVIPKPQPGAA